VRPLRSVLQAGWSSAKGASARRARTALTVRSEAWGEAAADSGAAALLWPRVRGPSVSTCWSMRLIRSPNGSITAARQLSRPCWVDGDLVALPPGAGEASAIRGNKRSRVMVSHVCSRSRACSRQVSARAHVDEAAMGTLRSVGIRVPSRWIDGCLAMVAHGHPWSSMVIHGIPWVSSHASGGAAPVDRCTERRWDTKDVRQLHPVGEAPSRRAHRGM